MSEIETSTRQRFGLSPSLVQLSSVRFKEYLREPEAVFWTFAFPIILAIGLGIAFRNRPAEVVHVAVVGPSAAASRVVTSARADSGLAVELLPADSASAALRIGRVALVVVPRADGTVEYQFDETRPDARNARLLVDNAIQHGYGRVNTVGVSETHVRERGSRYIDFVIPGLLGMNIMGSSIWGLGFTIVDARRKKLLKRLVATPMSRVEYLLAYLISRIVLLVAEVVVLLGFAAIFFGVPVRGSVIQLSLIILASVFAFGGLGLLIASRAQTIEGASGLMNVTMMPMWVLSGVFFSSENFPRAFQPLIQALPLTATNNALRASMLRGEGWTVVGPEILLLVVWAIATLWLALKWFRWR
ncbi:MAG TPA: ABC transporter permease [Gemmatimonadaceae bacterium]|nr:ABC transporter permease [Gemmatimonadaceae bacterium]